jgi:hypothetical protein
VLSWIIWTAAIVVMLAASGRPQSKQPSPSFHSPSPAGYTVVLLQPGKNELSILGLVDCPEMEGTQRVSEGIKAFLISADGERLKHYPREFSFRITATLRKTIIDGPSESFATKYDPKEFLLKLRFKLKAYNGLERQDIFPKAVKLIGMPADVSYDERIFRVTFDAGDLPISDRIVLQVLSPENQELTHFTFGLL